MDVDVCCTTISIPYAVVDGFFEEVPETRDVIMEGLRNRLLAGDVRVIDCIVAQFNEWASNEDLYELLNS
jgi:hypothetical protein